MAGYLLLFAIGVVILLFSTEYLAKISSKMWAALKLSPLIIGCTIVAIGTSLPEMAVSLTAVLKGDQGLATGNIVGSNIANILLVFAVGILLGHINIGISKTQKTGLMMLLATGLYLWLSFTVASPQVLGVILVGLAALFSLSEILMGVDGRKHEDKAFVVHKNSRFGPAMIGKVMVVVAGVILGGMIVVYSIEELSLVSGYSTTILGLSVTAIATSLPELLTIVFCRRKDQKKVAIGSILGSNTYNLLLVGGIVQFFSSAKPTFGTNLYFLIFSAVCGAALVFAYADKKVPKKIGFFLLLFFFIYIFTLR